MPAVGRRTEFAERIGVGQPHHGVGRRFEGKRKIVPERREDNGQVGGFHAYHGDGSVDATVFSAPATPRGEARP